MTDAYPLVDNLVRRIHRAATEISVRGGRYKPEEWQVVVGPESWERLVMELEVKENLRPKRGPDGELRLLGVPVTTDPNMALNEAFLRTEVPL